MSHPDVIVVGLGAMGSASLYQLAAQGVRVLGIDRFTPPHTQGSSHGETRITRLVTGEGDVFVPIVQRSHELWRTIEAASGETLFAQTGVLFLGDSGSDLSARVAGVAQRTKVAHELLTNAELGARFPQFQTQPDTTGLFDPAGGALFPERCVAAQLRLAHQQGATLHTDERVLAIGPNGNGVRVITNRDTYHAGQVVLTAGPWLSQLLNTLLADVLRVYRQVLYWFTTDQPAAFTPDRFPVFIWGHGERNGFYGFPTFRADGTVKVATSQLITTTDPDTVARVVTPPEITAMFDQHLAHRLPGLQPSAVQTATCLYTATPDGHFLFDRHPSWAQVLLVSACSGHGFKHSAAIGEAVAQQVVTGTTALDVAPFSLGRFQPTSA